MSYQIIVARSAGACYGVNRALDLARRAALNDGHAYTLGPLIHNPRVVEELEQNGIDVAVGLDDVEQGDTIVIRSHGVAPEVIRDAENRRLVIVDATCPHVSKAQMAARKLHEDGRFVIVVGEAGHPEVEAICAYAEGDVLVVTDAQMLPDTLPGRIGVVVQTTQSVSTFDEVVSVLEERCDDLIACNTICFATKQRQEAAAELAARVDCMLVVGGRNSGNTTRLFNICKKVCERTHHIESADEIDPRWFIGCKTIGVTAGASTPTAHIQSVVDHVGML